MKGLNVGRESQSFAAPPQGEVLVVREEGFGSPPELHRAWLELFRRLSRKLEADSHGGRRER